MERTRHKFEVIRLWEQPATLFLQYPGLIPFAVLGQSADAEETLRQAAQRMDRIADPTTQANLMAASGILAGLKLEQDMNLSSIEEGHHARIHRLSFDLCGRRG